MYTQTLLTQTAPKTEGWKQEVTYGIGVADRQVLCTPKAKVVLTVMNDGRSMVAGYLLKNQQCTLFKEGGINVDLLKLEAEDWLLTLAL